TSHAKATPSTTVKVMVVPVIRASEADVTLVTRLWRRQIPTLLLNTVWLMGTTITFTVVLGVALAWLVERTDLPGRSYWRWLLALPLALPGYVGAICMLVLLRRGGLVDQIAMAWAGFEFATFPLPDVTSLGGATTVIGLVTFPYVYLTVGASLRTSDQSLEDAARMSGRGPWQTFVFMTLPLLLPAIAAGALLVGMYVLSDFGTVALLRYQTFTTAIYQQIAGRVDRTSASILSMVLVMMNLPLLGVTAWINQRQRRFQRSSRWRPHRLITLGRWRPLALAFVGTIFSLSLAIPLLILAGYTIQGIVWPTEMDRLWGYAGERIWSHGWDSIRLATIGATLAIILSFSPNYLSARFSNRLVAFLLGLSKTAFALPGIIVGLGMSFFFLQAVPILYATVISLMLGMAFRLLPQAITTGEAAFDHVPQSLEQAARLMGHSPVRVFRRITIPIAFPGIVASWALVFITAMKELPLLIILRPPGFDTLTIRIWEAANDSIYTQASPPALLLVVLTLIPVALVYSNSRFGLNRAVEESALDQ
ncbi:MAG: iron ABC transporter permease, partial [Chloroflexota bacterium]